MLKLFYRFLIWAHQWEHDIGWWTGMNRTYLSKLRGLISDYERDLRRMT